MADVITSHIFSQPVFTWGSKSLYKKGEGRTTYLQALRAADKNEFDLLLVFARS